MAEIQRKRKRKKRKKTVVEHYLLYMLLRIVLFVVFLFKVTTMLKFARFLGKQLWKHYPRGRQRAIDNLRASYPDKDDEWIMKTGRKSFEHLLMLVIDILFTPRIIDRNNWKRYSRYKNIERTKWIMQEGKPLIMVAAHYSNFEIMGYLLGLFGFNVYSIARPLDNKFINKYLYSIREKRGQKIIDKKGASTKMEDIIKGGGTLCFVADQDAGKKGVFVDFFGRKASSYKSIALMAMQYNIPVCVGISRRVDDKFYFEIEVARMILPEEWADKDKPVKWITAEYTKAFEESIRKYPEQYWWIHRRWKTRPKSERVKQKV